MILKNAIANIKFANINANIKKLSSKRTVAKIQILDLTLD